LFYPLLICQHHSIAPRFARDTYQLLLALYQCDRLEVALDIVRTDVGQTLVTQIETTLEAMVADERELLTQRLAEINSRSAWARGLVAGGTILVEHSAEGGMPILENGEQVAEMLETSAASTKDETNVVELKPRRES
jgi:hypothetical protein